MFNRYKTTRRFINNSDQYNELFKSRNLNPISQYSRFDFNKLKNIDGIGLEITMHTVQPFERLQDISQKYYKTPDLGWLICYVNKIPNELSIKEGTILNIYFPINTLLGLL